MIRDAFTPARHDALASAAAGSVEHFNLPMRAAEFDYFRHLAFEHAGIVIADYKKAMVARRVAKRLRALAFASFEAYAGYLRSGRAGHEFEHLINALTTNKTEFFREDHHFHHLARTALPRAMRHALTNGQPRLRLWSAGCSTGQEPYTMAMIVAAALSVPGGWDAKILATDIDTDVLAHAKAGHYDLDELSTLPAAETRRFTAPVVGRPDRRQIDSRLRRMVTFKPLNLHDDWPMKGPFDIIFCRNVVIYFDRAHQEALFDRFASLLAPGGFLYCGHSESLVGLSARFRPAGRSIYEKIA